MVKVFFKPGFVASLWVFGGEMGPSSPGFGGEQTPGYC